MSPVFVMPTLLAPPGPDGVEGRRRWGGHRCIRDGGDGCGSHIVFFLFDRPIRFVKVTFGYKMMCPVFVLPTLFPPPGPRGGKGWRGWGGHTYRRDGGVGLDDPVDLLLV